MKITVQLFAAAKDAAGKSKIEVNLDVAATVSDLRSALVAEATALQPLHDSLLVAVNNEYATDDTRLNEHDEVACFPPVSGG